MNRPDLVTSCLFLVSLMQLAVGSEQSSDVPRSLPSTTNATDSESLKSCSAERSRDASVALFVLVFTQI